MDELIDQEVIIDEECYEIQVHGIGLRSERNLAREFLCLLGYAVAAYDTGLHRLIAAVEYDERGRVCVQLRRGWEDAVERKGKDPRDVGRTLADIAKWHLPGFKGQDPDTGNK